VSPIGLPLLLDIFDVKKYVRNLTSHRIYDQIIIYRWEWISSY